ncbi:DUF2065 domain-containing protein [Maritalea sp.]|jgi:uncharacterized protein YjeT (DUF2065 family)|uniref:DUF2065 domain-containing protein n=1 Tax=Maritalea sp. TaxID=2003361 RepID=UPI0039E393DB
MQDLFVALALALVVEGLLYAAFPVFMKKMIASVLLSPDAQIRVIGITTATIGLIILFWLRQG